MSYRMSRRLSRINILYAKFSSIVLSVEIVIYPLSQRPIQCTHGKNQSILSELSKRGVCYIFFRKLTSFRGTRVGGPVMVPA